MMNLTLKVYIIFDTLQIAIPDIRALMSVINY